MEKPFIQFESKDFTRSSYDVIPSEGYIIPKNHTTGEIFPNCCPFHKSVFNNINNWFEKFPECCDEHKAMVGQWWFKKENYSGLPEKIIKQVSYTEYQFSKEIESSDWYKKISDYIEYNVDSFGHPAIGVIQYLRNIQVFLKSEKLKVIPNDKRDKLFDFTESFFNNDETSQTDLNILYSTYQKWLKIFPFDISYFSTLKGHYEKQLPFIIGKPEINIYSGITKAKMHTRSSLIEVLVTLTDNLLTKINSLSLYEQGLINDTNKVKLELVIYSRKLKLNEGYKNNSTSEEQQYRKILKEWFKDEKKFIDDIKPLIKDSQPGEKQIETDKPTSNTFGLKNNFDKVLINDVFSHFKKNLVEKGYLTDSELTEYIKAAFDKVEIPKVLFKLKNVTTKQKVIRIFYDYYKNVAWKPHKQQTKYCELLSNYFEGYVTQNVKTNFTK